MYSKNRIEINITSNNVESITELALQYQKIVEWQSKSENKRARTCRFYTKLKPNNKRVTVNNSELVQQFLRGEADGPVPFHFPAGNLAEQLIGHKIENADQASKTAGEKAWVT